MRTLYLRNVPESVGERLAWLAKREGLSLSAFAVRELSLIARRADNPTLLDGLPSVDVTPDDILAALDEGRAPR